MSTAEQLETRPSMERPLDWDWWSRPFIADSNGTPRVMYHGTGATISNGFRELSFFTPHPEIAQIYAYAPTRQVEGGGPNIVPVYLRISAPYVHDDSAGENLSHAVLGRRGSHAQVMEELVRRGHDGILIQNYLDLGGMQDQWVIFKSEQAISIFAVNPENESPAPYERARG